MRSIPLKRISVSVLLGLATIFALRTVFAAPSHDRHWKAEFAVLPKIARDGNAVTISNIRSWRYDGNGPVSMEWTERNIDTSRVKRVALLVEPFEKWNAIAHTFLVFDFTEGDPLVFSVEARGEIDENYHPIAGALRRYELAYLFGTERDLVVRRAVPLDHPLYLFPLSTDGDFPGKLLSDLVDATNELSGTPRFYNTFLHNCTNTLAESVNRVTPGAIPWDISFLLPGYSPAFLQKLGYLSDTVDMRTDFKRFRIDDIVRDIALSDDFSSELRIRAAARRGF